VLVTSNKQDSKIYLSTSSVNCHSERWGQGVDKSGNFPLPHDMKDHFLIS